jgi:hypothetical protein
LTKFKCVTLPRSFATIVVRIMRNRKLLTLTAVMLLVLGVLAPINMIAHAQATPVAPSKPPGTTQQTACPINSNVTYIYHINSTCTPQYYNFTAYNKHWINVTITPPSSTSLYVELVDPRGISHSPVIASNTTVSYINFCASSGGVWSLRIDLYQGNGGSYTFYIAPVNRPPATPSLSSTHSLWYVYNQTSFNASTTDPDNDNVTYTFRWGDGTNSTTSSSPSGAVVTANHQWSIPGTYSVTVRAQDQYGALSAWSNPTNITISQNDANSGRDAGVPGTSNPAIWIPRSAFNSSVYTANGTLYNSTSPMDTDDYYEFTLMANDNITILMTPPTNAIFGMKLMCLTTGVSNTTTPGNTMQSLTERVTSTSANWQPGNYTLDICLGSNPTKDGYGQYTFSLSTAEFYLQLSANDTVKGLTFKIANVGTYSGSANVWLKALTTYTITVSPTSVLLAKNPLYSIIEVFVGWSSGQTSATITITLTGNTSLIAGYTIEFAGKVHPN